MQEKPYQVIFQSVESLKFTWIMPICSYFRGESPHLFTFLFFFLLNVFEHKIEVIMSWQICREVLNAYMDPAHQTVTAFLRTSFEI